MLKVFNRIVDLQNQLFEDRKQGKEIGLVPTMGALHEGHASLVRRSVKENGITVVSVFVNPTQFNDKNDLKNYPRTLEADCQLLEACGADYVLAPSVEEMYPTPDTRQFEYPPVSIAVYLDSIDPMSDEEVKMLSDSITVNEQLNAIFRRRFEQKAKAQLTPLYGTEENGSSENDYLAKSEKVMKELYDYARQLSRETGIGIDNANSMATQIISHLQAQLQENISRNGTMTKSKEE